MNKMLSQFTNGEREDFRLWTGTHDKFMSMVKFSDDEVNLLPDTLMVPDDKKVADVNGGFKIRDPNVQ